MGMVEISQEECKWPCIPPASLPEGRNTYRSNLWLEDCFFVVEGMIFLVIGKRVWGMEL